MGSVSVLIDSVRKGDRAAGNKLWERFGPPLSGEARGNLPSKFQRALSGWDLANAAIVVIVQGLSLGRWPEVRRRGQLWGLLRQTAYFQALNEMKKLNRRPEFDHVESIEAVDGREPAPDARRIEEEENRRFESLMARLAAREAILERIARELGRGKTRVQIAGELGCSVRKVERKVEKIRQFLETEWAS